MSGISPLSTSDYGSLTTLVADSASISRKLDQLTEQASTGDVASTYAGLGANASVSLDLNPQLANLTTWQNNISAATGDMQVTQTAMTQIQSIASDLLSQLNSLEGADGSAIDTVAATARDQLAQVANLLDSTNGSTYVFAGTDSSSPPVPNPDSITSSGFYTQIAAAVANLDTNGSSATAAATLGIASSNTPGTTPFSSTIGSVPVIQTGNDQMQQVGLLANANSYVASTGSSTTGSYMRDLMRALATVGSLSDSQQNDPNLPALIQDTRTSLTGAINAMAEDTGVLGNQQSALSTESQSMQQTSTALSAQLSSVQDVDMAQTLSTITQVQTQLQASYQLISNVSDLSLAKFLPS
jgi:flagellar hook-associated protein 3 FlgL